MMWSTRSTPGELRLVGDGRRQVPVALAAGRLREHRARSPSPARSGSRRREGRPPTSRRRTASAGTTDRSRPGGRPRPGPVPGACRRAPGAAAGPGAAGAPASGPRGGSAPPRHPRARARACRRGLRPARPASSCRAGPARRGSARSGSVPRRAATGPAPDAPPAPPGPRRPPGSRPASRGAAVGRWASPRSRTSSDQKSRLTGEYGLGSGGSVLKVGSRGRTVTRSPPRSRTQRHSDSRSRRSPTERLRAERSAASCVPTPQLRCEPGRRHACTGRGDDGAGLAAGPRPRRSGGGSRRAERRLVRSSAPETSSGTTSPSASCSSAWTGPPRGDRERRQGAVPGDEDGRHEPGVPAGAVRPAAPRRHRRGAAIGSAQRGADADERLGGHGDAPAEAVRVAGVHAHRLGEGAERRQLIHARTTHRRTRTDAQRTEHRRTDGRRTAARHCAGRMRIAWPPPGARTRRSRVAEVTARRRDGDRQRIVQPVRARAVGVDLGHVPPARRQERERHVEASAPPRR